MLRVLSLNHALPASTTPLLGQLLLVLGLCAAAGLGWSLHQLGQQRQRLETDISRMQSPHAQARPPAGKASQSRQEEIRAVQGVLHELALPWPSLFQALESLRVPDVRLAAIEPRANQRKLRITADTGEVVNMFTYVHQLSEQAIFNDVLLVSHELHTGQDVPVRFVVEAVWVQH